MKGGGRSSVEQRRAASHQDAIKRRRDAHYLRELASRRGQLWRWVLVPNCHGLADVAPFSERRQSVLIGGSHFPRYSDLGTIVTEVSAGSNKTPAEVKSLVCTHFVSYPRLCRAGYTISHRDLFTLDICIEI